MADLLEIKALAKTYDSGARAVKVLENISLNINRGDFVALLGPSGSGKSTLLNIIGLLDKPTAGTILLDGREILGLPENEKAKLRLSQIGFVLQFDALLAEFTVLENVDMPAMLAENPDAEKARHALSHFGLEDIAERLPAEVSGGERQRAAVARAMRNNPALILADEPTGNLDKDNAAIVFGDFKKLSQKGTAVLMVTHNELALDYATRGYFLKNGRLEEIKKG